MTDVAIQVAGLGKRYHLGAGQAPYATLREHLRKLVSIRRLLLRTTWAENRPSFWALKDVSFEVRPGEVVGIIGRNGAGKSTLLKILSRITEPTEGGVDLLGRVGSLLEVGTGFHPELTGRENVFLNGAILGMRRAEIVSKFDNIVAFAEVEMFIDTPVKHYSSGMYTRLAFAVAAHLDPEILIVDEVLAVGDAAFQKKCLGKMGEVAQSGRTVLFVSHNMGSIQSLCQRCVILQHGRLGGVGPTAEMVPQYLAANASGNVFDRSGHEDKPITIRSATVEVTGDQVHTWLVVTTTVHSKLEATVSIDLRVADAFGTPVGFAPIGSFNQGETVRLLDGLVTVTSVHDITTLADGSYNLGIDIAEPTIGYHDRLDQCLTFEVTLPCRPGTYRRMQQAWRFGSVEFPLARMSVEPSTTSQTAG